MKQRQIVMAGGTITVSAKRAEMLVRTGRAQYAEIIASAEQQSSSDQNPDIETGDGNQTPDGAGDQTPNIETAEAAPKPETTTSRRPRKSRSRKRK